MSFAAGSDYTIFFHGFSFFLLAAVILLLRQHLKAPLKWLALSSALYGLSLWTGLASVGLPSSGNLERLHVAVLCLSLGALGRFALGHDWRGTFRKWKNGNAGENKTPLTVAFLSFSLYVLLTLADGTINGLTLPRSFLAFATSMSLWWLHCSFRRNFRPFGQLLALMGGILLLGWLATEGAGELGDSFFLGPYFRLAVIGITFLFCMILLIAFLGYEQQANARLAIANSEHQYRSIFEQNGLVTLLVDPATGAILEANRAASRFYGFSRTELETKKIWNLSTQTESEAREQMEESLRRTNHRMEARHRRADESLRHVEVYSVKMPYSGRTVLYLVVHDISEKKRMEAEKEAVLSQLIQSAKLASIGTLAAGVAHEINNPLTILKGFIGILREQFTGLPESPETKDTLAILDKQDQAVDRIASIVNGLRTYARADTDRTQPVSIHQIIEDTLTLVEAVYRKQSIKLVLKLNSCHPVIEANTGKLQQVLINLLSNASDALEGQTGEKQIEIRTFDDHDKVQLWVRDNGCGIDPAIQDRIGDPFFTTKPPGKGTGLGLSISRSLVQSFQGDMTMESALGKGTLFRLSFPKAAGAPPPSLTSVRRNFQFSGAALIVDDEPDIRAMLRDYLLSFNMSVAEAEDGKHALEQLRKHPFRLALIDLHLPVLPGDALLSQLHETSGTVATRCLMMTGGQLVDLTPEKQQLIARLAQGVIHKPFSREDIGKAIEAALNSAG